MSLRIAMLSYHTCPLATLGGKNTGGMNVYVQQLTHHLGKLGIHVDVFTRSQDEHIPQVLHDLGYGNRVVHIPAGPEIPLSKQELSQHIPEFVENIFNFARKKGLEYDLIHSHYWMSGIAAIQLKQKWQIPYIHMFHTLGKMKNRIARSESEKEGDYRIHGEMEVIETADCLVGATQAEKSQLAYLYNAQDKPTVIIPPGVDTSHFYPIPEDEAKEVIGIPQDDRIILFVGRIEPLKGIETLIQAIGNLQNQGYIACCETYLVIIGGDPDSYPKCVDQEIPRLKQLCKDIGIGDLVLFIGKRTQDMLPYYYSAAKVVVVPSHYESFGMVALEAMACGTPVIASQVGGLAYLIQDEITGYSIPNNDPDLLSQRLVKLLSNSDLRTSMGNNASEYAAAYDWNNIASRIAELYQQVLDGNIPVQKNDEVH